MFSVTYTGMCCLPLCTAIVSPTKSGSTVDRRDHVLIGRLSLVARTAPIFLIRWASTNGPFFTERPIVLYPLAFVTALHDHGTRALVAASTVALGLGAPRTDRMHTSRSLTFAATVRVINRIHDHTADGRTDTTPTVCTGLADRAQAVLLVTYLANRCAALHVHAADLAGTQANLSVDALTRQQLGGSPGGPGQLGSLAGESSRCNESSSLPECCGWGACYPT